MTRPHSPATIASTPAPRMAAMPFDRAPMRGRSLENLTYQIDAAARTKAFDDRRAALARIAIFVGVALSGLIMGAAIALTIATVQTNGFRALIAPTTLESQFRSIEQLVEGAR